jgi:hypothetical protein
MKPAVRTRPSGESVAIGSIRCDVLTLRTPDRMDRTGRISYWVGEIVLASLLGSRTKKQIVVCGSTDTSLRVHVCMQHAMDCGEGTAAQVLTRREGDAFQAACPIRYASRPPLRLHGSLSVVRRCVRMGRIRPYAKAEPPPQAQAVPMRRDGPRATQHTMCAPGGPRGTFGPAPHSVAPALPWPAPAASRNRDPAPLAKRFPGRI